MCPNLWVDAFILIPTRRRQQDRDELLQLILLLQEPKHLGLIFILIAINLSL